MSFRSIRSLFSPSVRKAPARLRLTRLEEREVPSVTLADIPNQDIFTDRPLFIPVTVTNTPDGPVTVTTQSNTTGLTAEVLTGGRSIKLNVSGVDNTGAAFTGDLTIRLFENVAPLATGNIISLINQGFYNSKEFHRIIDGFMIQGGSPNGDGLGGSSLVSDVNDEFNRDYTFASGGLLAMANATDDNNNSQFFITDIDLPIGDRASFLNFNHSIVGILTDGFDIYTKIIQTPVQSNGSETSDPVATIRINSASVFTDTENAVIKLTPATGFTGTASIDIFASDGPGTPTQESFTLTGVTYPNNPLRSSNDNPFLGPISNITTTAGSPVSVTLTSTDLQNNSVTYGLTATGTNASQVTINLNTATGVATITPASGFTGVVNLRATVRDAGNVNDAQAFTLTVNSAGSTSTTTVTLSKATTVVGFPVLATATVTGVTNTAGTLEFFSDGVSLGVRNVYDGKAAIQITPGVAGSDVITAKFVPTSSTITGSTSADVTLGATAGTAPRKFNATAGGVGSAPTVSATDATTGANLFSLTVFESTFTGGVRIAVADVTGDGQDDIVAVAGQGGSSLVRVIDGGSGTIVQSKMMFEDSFRGGLVLDVGDFLGKGYSQVVFGAGRTGGPRVTVWDFVQNKQIYNYFAYDSTLRGGVTVDAADLRGNGFAVIVTGAGQGAGPVVAVWDGAKAAVTDGQTAVKYGQFFAGDTTGREGIRVGAGEPRANRTRLILVGPQVPDNSTLNLNFDPFVLGVFTG
jgi:cyclophilin family peptidyl-prolyl cis-trans isomerase